MKAPNITQIRKAADEVEAHIARGDYHEAGVELQASDIDLIDLLAIAEVHAPVVGVLTHDEKAVELYRRVWSDVVAVCPDEAPPLEELTAAESATMRALFSSMVSGISVMLSARTAGAGRPVEAGGSGE